MYRIQPGESVASVTEVDTIHRKSGLDRPIPITVSTMTTHLSEVSVRRFGGSPGASTEYCCSSLLLDLEGAGTSTCRVLPFACRAVDESNADVYVLRSSLDGVIVGVFRESDGEFALIEVQCGWVEGSADDVSRFYSGSRDVRGQSGSCR